MRITEEPLLVECYVDMEQLEPDHEPRHWPDDRFSSNTWGPLPPRSYFRFDDEAVQYERESLEMLGEKLPPLEVHDLMATTEKTVAARTGEQFLDGLRGDAREIWLNGEKITHPLEHPALRGGRAVDGARVRPPARARRRDAGAVARRRARW